MRDKDTILLEEVYLHGQASQKVRNSHSQAYASAADDITKIFNSIALKSNMHDEIISWLLDNWADNESEIMSRLNVNPIKEAHGDIYKSYQTRRTPTIDNIDPQSVEIDNIDRNDYPDFVDAYISSASYNDGTELSEDELDQLNNNRETMIFISTKIHEDQLWR